MLYRAIAHCLDLAGRLLPGRFRLRRSHFSRGWVVSIVRMGWMSVGQCSTVSNRVGYPSIFPVLHGVQPDSSEKSPVSGPNVALSFEFDGCSSAILPPLCMQHRETNPLLIWAPNRICPQQNKNQCDSEVKLLRSLGDTRHPVGRPRNGPWICDRHENCGCHSRTKFPHVGGVLQNPCKM